MADAVTITLLNSHADDFVSTPVSFSLIGRKGLRKYSYLLEQPISRGQRAQILVDGTLSSLVDQWIFNRMPRWLRAVILRVEIYFWLRNNDLAGRVDLHWSLDTIKDRAAIYIFSYKHCVGAFGDRVATISAFDRVLVNLSHYFIRTREKVENIAKLRNVILVADSDLTRNTYFQHFFPHSPPLLCLPFAVESRFRVILPVENRTSKCGATGSFHDLMSEEPRVYYKDFIEFFHTNTYHPVRKLLYHRRAELSSWLECRISPFREAGGIGSAFGRLRQWLKLDVAQTEYFSFDIVDFYNQHRFAIVGEELSGAPAVGFFEAMACGCVMLGAAGGYYNGLGLKPGTHYLEHDGTVDSIQSIVVGTASNPQRLAAILAESRTYIDTNCTPRSVWEALQTKLATFPARDS
jgi:hypothetical protein